MISRFKKKKKINLEELPTQLRFRRFEFKYHIPIFLINAIVSDLLYYMDWDPYVLNKEDKSYQVSSLYFDNDGLGCYHEKLAGIKKRKKLRIRTYAASNIELTPESKVFVEIKRKNDMTILKDRLVIDYKDHFDFLNNHPVRLVSEVSGQDKKTLNEFLWTKMNNCMIPKIMVVYERQPLIGKIDSRFRITFDSGLQVFPADRLCFKEKREEVMPGLAVMELKYNHSIPGWFCQILKKYQLNREPFSKYCLCLEDWHKKNKYV